MRAFKYDIEFEQGATYRKTFTWKVGKPATPVNLTGCTAFASFRLKDPPTTKRSLVLEITTENGGIVLGGDAGTVEIVVPATDTVKFSWDKADYQLYIAHPDGAVTRLMEGVAEVSHSV